MARFPAVPYVVPFCAFMALVGLGLLWSLPPLTDQLLRLAIMGVVLFWVARPALDFRVQHWGGTPLVGVLIFVLWIAPDLIFPTYRHAFPFNNSLVGVARSSLPEAARHDAPVLFLRSLRAVVVVSMVEELFWRGWLMRWLIKPDFQQVPLGTFELKAFVITALLFALEHGSYWDVGLMAGVAYNYWMVRTKSLGDLILAHAVTNGCLTGYVLLTGNWQYW